MEVSNLFSNKLPLSSPVTSHLARNSIDKNKISGIQLIKINIGVFPEPLNK